MSEKPIIFSGPMVRAILEGRKTQTRRMIKPAPTMIDGRWVWKNRHDYQRPVEECRPRQVCDLLWVRESGWERPSLSARELRDGADTWPRYAYDADDDWERDWLKEQRYKRHPSIHMPRWASRITLKVADVRVQRLQDISAKDALAEGAWCETCLAMNKSACLGLGCFAAVQAFRYIWENINGPGSWDKNPWVAAYTFERIKP